jgi:hypothetical protein
MKPTVVVRKNPSEVFLNTYGQGRGQRLMIEHYTVLLKEMEEIKKLMPNVESEVKLFRKMGKQIRRKYEAMYNDLYEQAKVIEKHLDYGIVLTASLPEINTIDEQTDWPTIKSLPGPFVVRAMASKKYIEHAVKSNTEYIFLENGYFGNYKSLVNEKSKKIWHRVCINEVQQEEILKVPDDRWQNLVNYDQRLQWNGWKKTGSKILLVLPSSKPCQYYGQDVNQWKDWVISEIQKHTDRELVIREKSSRTSRTQKNTIYDALDDDIFCTVTYQSIAAVESVAYGIPAFTLAPSAAKAVSLQNLSLIETPYYPDEDLVRQWCSSLAYGQFSMDEMLNGTAWNMILENKHREKISY